MKHLIVAITFAVGLAGGVAAQSVHPPTREGFGAKSDSPETQRERVPEPPAAHRPDAQGGANSQHNREYGSNAQPDGKSLTDGKPQAPR